MHKRTTPESVTVNRETGEVFATRKEAKDKYGVAYYRKLLRDNIIYFTNYIANDELQENRPEGTTIND